MAYDPARGVSVLFGGMLANGLNSGETWEWNGTVWTQRAIAGPRARYFPAMAYDAVRGGMLLFGGYTSGATVGGTNGETWSLSRCAADFNGDGSAAIQDIFDYLNAWFAGDPRTDFNRNGIIEVQDIFDFLDAWFVGC
jgi:hypothetical protein